MVKKNYSIMTLIVIVLIYQLLCGTVHASNEQQLPLEQRVTILEKKIELLESIIAELTESKTGKMISKPVNTVNKWKNIELWRVKLNKGMTKPQVRALFGEPDKIEVYSYIGDTWHYGYPSGGTISFSKDGSVESWSEPSPSDMK